MPVDYSKWANLDLSDDEEEDNTAKAQDMQKAQAEMAQRAAEQQRQAEEAQQLNAAIDAAAMASSVGHQDALDAMMAHAQQSAPLDPEMEAVLSTLPEAARIAARASAAASKVAAPPKGQAGKEPTLAELLKAQNISLDDADDPGLEDVREFFETADEAAAAEKRLAEAAARAEAATAAMAATAVRSAPSRPKQLDPSRIEEL